MPTIQEEMSKVLNEWNKPVENNQPENTTMNHPLTKNQFGVTNNVTRVTFDYVKNNPGTTAAQAAAALMKQGYKLSSVTSVMAQMARGGSMRKEKYKYFVVGNEYTPIKAWKKSDRTLKKAEKVAESVKTLEKLAETAKPKATITVQSIVENMTMREARELYNELGKYFGA